MKFKVGDKVKVISNDHFNGLVGEVKEVNHCSDDCYCDYMVSFGSSGEYEFDDHELTPCLTEIITPNTHKTKGKFEQIAQEIGSFTQMKNEAYGSSVDATEEVMKIYLKRYKNEDGTYTIPEELLPHILLQVRIMDKQNRLFSNPKGDKLGESQYRDIGGYALIGIEKDERK